MDAYSWSVPILLYGSKWKRGRRLFYEFFNVKAVDSFDDYQRKHARRFISRLSQTPEDFLAHSQLCVFPLPSLRPPIANVRFPKRDRRVDHGYNVRFGYQIP